MKYSIYDSSCVNHPSTESLRDSWEACQKRRKGGYPEAYVSNLDNIDYDWFDGLTDDERCQLEEWDHEALLNGII